MDCHFCGCDDLEHVIPSASESVHMCRVKHARQGGRFRTAAFLCVTHVQSKTVM